MNKHAYLIMAYRIETINVLLEQLDYELNDIYLHIDKKNKNVDYAQLGKNIHKSKLFIFQEYDVSWGDISQTMCQIFLLGKAYQSEYSYYHLLSETDFPLKSNKAIYNFFEKNGSNFVHFESRELPSYKKEWVDYYYLFQKNNRHSRILTFMEKINIKIQKIVNIHRILDNEKYSCGANWFSINKKLAGIVLKNKANIYKRYKNTRSSDEIYLQTLIINNQDLCNSLFYKKYDNNYLACQRYIDWSRGKPYVFSEKDFDELVSTDMCFARKMNLNDNIRIMIKNHIQKEEI